jgi:hypothetical protein
MNIRLVLALLLFVDTLLLVYGASTLSISYKEALVYFEQENFIHYLVKFSTSLFGQNDYALRLPFILFHLGSILLLYKISQFFLHEKVDQLLAVMSFMLLPGIVGSALLVNAAGVSIFFTLLFIWLFLKGYRVWYMLLLPLLLIVDNSFMVLYLGLFTYAIYVKDRWLSAVSAVLFLAALSIYGFPMHGKPKGYIIDTLISYSLIFSPLLFLYFFYTLYRILMKEKKNVIWFISFIALVFSILISYRQRILIDDFAPYVVVSVPLMVKMFMSSYRVRLPENRRGYKIMFVIVFMILAVNFVGTYTYKFLYLTVDNPKKHFAYKYNIAKELAEKLKELGIQKVTADKKMQLRLRFYGIEKGNLYKLSENKIHDNDQKVTISYIKKPVKVYYVSKVNK